jgi:protein Hikeshi
MFTSANADGMQSFLAEAAQQQGSDQGIVSQIGISLEPIETLEAQLQASGVLASAAQVTTSSILSDPKLLAEKVAKNLFDYLGSFFPDPRAIGPDSAVPMGAIKKWYENFISKVERVGVGFLERSGA